MYNNSLPKLNPISGVQIHSEHKLSKSKKKSNTSHNAFIMLGT